ncbi:hypothetical protein AXF42_Ash007733 [Apostasia shenzhenica]|uniref:Uncharacterized protein n=1 Tax=Apostasia shenzhenica TaxID=1088818 RepID=A0A2I0B558_9ASPA|nr:hypothetical protein AXF42_Ash007733 [Apostasia shenzhenica]
MAGEGTLKNLEKLKGQNWPLKDFLRHVKNDISLNSQALGYVIFKETIPLPSTILMKRARRGQPPSTQLSNEIVKVGEGQGDIEVPELVGSGTAVDVASSSEDTMEDGKTLAEVLKSAGKGKEPATPTKPKVVPKSNKGIVLGGDKGQEKAKKEGQRKEDKGQDGAQEKGVEGAAASPFLDLMVKEVSKRKRDPLEKRSPEAPSKKGRTAEEGQMTFKEMPDWQRSIDGVNFTGRFGDDSAKIAMETRENGKRLTILSQQSSSQGLAVPVDMGLAIGGDLVTKDLEERMEKTSTSDSYANVANRMIVVRVSPSLSSSLITVWLSCANSTFFFCRCSLVCPCF